MISSAIERASIQSRISIGRAAVDGAIRTEYRLGLIFAQCLIHYIADIIASAHAEAGLRLNNRKKFIQHRIYCILINPCTEYIAVPRC